MTDSAPTFPTLGILGGGQLGKMLAQAAIRMGFRVKFLSPHASGPMQGLGAATVADWTDADVLAAWSADCTAVTVESEWAPADALAAVRPDLPLWPAPRTLQLIRHKGVQKQTLADAGLPVPAFARCATLDDARAAAERFGLPVLFKQYERSYDGYGNATVRTGADVESAWNDLAADDGLLVEAFAPFVRELSVLVARTPDGAQVVYPVAYSEQRDHRCHAVVVPAEVSDAVRDEAQRVAVGAVEAVGGVGITAVELFEMEDGSVLVNELAPRPHNTGHFSIEGSHTSQFENHVRGVLGLPLGDPGMRAPFAVMINILGHRTGDARPDGLTDALAVPGAAVHLYGKPQVKPKRKMGHVTCTGPDPADTRARAERAAEAVRL